jgi:hypothetical protein
LENEQINDFGFREALLDLSFYEEFIKFTNSKNPKLYNFPKLYEWVKFKIWYIIIHQQQVEGIFNIFDIKTNKNMSLDTQRSKLYLAKTSFSNLKFTNNDLKKVNIKQKEISLFDNENISNIQAADNLFDKLFNKK